MYVEGRGGKVLKEGCPVPFGYNFLIIHPIFIQQLAQYSGERVESVSTFIFAATFVCVF